MVARAVAAAGVALVLTAALARAQPPPRDPAADPRAKGSGRMSGRVTGADTGKPLRRANVAVVAASAPDLGVLPPGARRTTTDDDGRWELRDLPAGRYVITVSKAGYVRTQYGQRYARERARVVELGNGAALDRLDVRMTKTGVIAGRLGDEQGEPITPAMVSVHRIAYVDGVRTLKPVAEGIMALFSGGLTDDRGEYRIHGLPPGTYYVSAAADSVGSGGVGDTPHLAATYYPGTANVSEAQPLTIGAGEELLNVSFNLSRTRAAKLSGVVIGSNGQPIVAAVRLTSTSAVPIRNEVDTTADGRFTLADVPPGDYRLEVESVRYGAKEVSLIPLVVTGDDLPDLVIATRRGATASGRIVSDEGTRPPPGVDVYAAAASRESFVPALAPGRRSNETFEISGLLGWHHLRARMPPGWFLKSITIDGQSIADSGYEFKPGVDVAGIELTVTRRPTSLRGVVNDGDAITSDYTVLAFSTDERRWGPHTRYVQTGRATQSHEFRLEGLPPDEYFVIALDYLEPGDETDPGHLERWRNDATRVTVGADEPATVTLKLKR